MDLPTAAAGTVPAGTSPCCDSTSSLSAVKSPELNLKMEKQHSNDSQSRDRLFIRESKSMGKCGVDGVT
jgi:hypothetical protein